MELNQILYILMICLQHLIHLGDMRQDGQLENMHPSMAIYCTGYYTFNGFAWSKSLMVSDCKNSVVSVPVDYVLLNVLCAL